MCLTEQGSLMFRVAEARVVDQISTGSWIAYDDSTLDLDKPVSGRSCELGTTQQAKPVSAGPLSRILGHNQGSVSSTLTLGMAKR